MYKKISIIFLIKFFFLITISAFAETDLTGKQIVEKTDDILRGFSTNKATIEMTIITPKWYRTIKMKTWGEKLEKAMVRIFYPPKEQGIGTLKVHNEVWIYLSEIEKTVKISPSMMTQPWMGSDFTYEDIVNTDTIIKDYDHKLKGKINFENIEVFEIESIPKPNAPVVWGKLRLLNRTDNYLPVKQEYYNESGELIKVLTYSGIKDLGGKKYPSHLEMKQMNKKERRTVMDYIDIVFDKPIDNNIYSLHNLKSAKYEQE